jgi:predicted N-acyltransferase
VNSWLTGRRLVSVPFSDHCDPLLDEDEKCFESLMTAVQEEADSKKLRYVEVRSTLPCESESPLARKKISFFFHTLDLAPSLGELFAGCHHSSTQRKIRRAEREQLTCREGRSEDLLSLFYELFIATRQRHHIPPPPRKWFSNLLQEFGDAIKISVAFNKHRHVAAIVTLRYKDTFIYKYGACDPAFTNQGSMQFLLWRAIEEAKLSGFRHFDFGRTDLWQQGLVTFKDRWGTTRKQIEYRRYSRSERKTLHVFELNSRPAWKRASEAIVSHMPARLLVTIGSSLYGHAG